MYAIFAVLFFKINTKDHYMAIIKDPITFSKQFKISKVGLDKLGIFNPTLNVDTKLFIDPLLLETCKHPEISSSSEDF